MFTKNDTLLNIHTEEDVYRKIIPLINKSKGGGIVGGAIEDAGRLQNCKRCTYAYEMMRRGYQVAATYPITPNGSGQTPIAGYNATRSQNEREVHWNGSKRGVNRLLFLYRNDLEGAEKMFNTINYHINGDVQLGKNDNIFETLKRTYPTGARGELVIQWDDIAKTGHSVAWEIFDGKPVIFDAQTKDRLLNMDDVANYCNENNRSIKQINTIRLDDKEINTDFLLKWCEDTARDGVTLDFDSMR